MKSLTVFDAIKRKGYVGPVDGGSLMLSPFSSSSSASAWNPITWESFAGAWQQNYVLSKESLLSFSAVYSCVTLIASDIAKLRLKLVQETKDGICVETTSPSFSPVLTKPNHYQNRIQFLTCWIISKLSWGNAYILKQRDARGVVTAMYPLDPARVKPLIATDGSIFYQLSPDYLSEVDENVIVPAREMIHDIMVPLFHPLVGVSPLYACNYPACIGLEIQKNEAKFFKNGAKISGLITAPGAISEQAAKNVKEKFENGYTGDNAGKIAVLGDGLKFQALTMTSTDAQLIEQLKLSEAQICSAFHVPAYKVGVGPLPTHDNIEALNQQYYDQCLQILVESMELCLEEGLNCSPYEIEADLDGLLRMDTASQYATYGDGIKNSVLAPNEARKKLNYAPVKGGDSPMAQQQQFSLEALAKRDALPDPFVIDRPTANPTPSINGPAPVADPATQPKQFTDTEIDEAMSLVFRSVAPLRVAA